MSRLVHPDLRGVSKAACRTALPDFPVLFGAARLIRYFIRMTGEQHYEHSVWLMPDGEMQAELATETAALARAAGQPPFSPHVTVAGDLKGAPLCTAALCQEIFSNQEPFPAKVSAVATGPSYFMSLFLCLSVPDSVLAAREKLIRKLAVPGTRPWQPHISVAYGMPNGAGKTAEQRRLSELYLDRTISIGAVVVSRSSVSVPASAWKDICRFRLGKSSD
ncbi:hypothetical protein [uncultured Roseobacter sp.]|uniref:hypothetical protein n=1 Tax=uncultured Roseobacter sp. TaxID=114847 RepID=UPI00260B3E12|nr:hypothetical protein [uncultured Roseobacter sp.]